jgi:hypothetical protein
MPWELLKAHRFKDALPRGVGECTPGDGAQRVVAQLGSSGSQSVLFHRPGLAGFSGKLPFREIFYGPQSWQRAFNLGRIFRVGNMGDGGLSIHGCSLDDVEGGKVSSEEGIKKKNKLHLIYSFSS